VHPSAILSSKAGCGRKWEKKKNWGSGWNCGRKEPGIRGGGGGQVALLAAGSFPRGGGKTVRRKNKPGYYRKTRRGRGNFCGQAAISTENVLVCFFAGAFGMGPITRALPTGPGARLLPHQRGSRCVSPRGGDRFWLSAGRRQAKTVIPLVTATSPTFNQRCIPSQIHSQVQKSEIAYSERNAGRTLFPIAGHRLPAAYGGRRATGRPKTRKGQMQDIATFLPRGTTMGPRALEKGFAPRNCRGRRGRREPKGARVAAGRSAPFQGTLRGPGYSEKRARFG